MKEINFKILIIVLALSLIVFFTGNFLVNSYQVNRALRTDLLAIDGVEDVEIDKLKTKYKLKFSLSKVNNFQQTFSQIQERVDESLVDTEYKLSFSAQDTGGFKEFYDQLNLALHEALTTGKFVKLQDRIIEYKQKYRLEQANIQIDSQHIYLTLVKGSDAVYKVIDRKG